MPILEMRRESSSPLFYSKCNPFSSNLLTLSWYLERSIQQQKTSHFIYAHCQSACVDMQHKSEQQSVFVFSISRMYF